MAIKPLPPPLHAPATEREGVATRPWSEFYNMLFRYQQDHDALVQTVSNVVVCSAGTMIYSGTGAPAAGSGINGDYYFNTANGDWYIKESGAWGSPISNLSGVDGADGATGPAGPQGETGDISSEWVYFVTTWSETPAFVETIAAGDVYSYVLDATTRYRLVPDPYDAGDDAFYSGFTSPNLSGLIASRG